MAGIRVMVVDDQQLITQSFEVLLQTRADDIEVVGLARDGREAVKLAGRLEPDVVLMDVRMPVMDGVQAAAAIHQRYPAIRVLMLTTFDDDEYVQEAIRSGAMGYLLKDISTEELISAIRAVHQGSVLVSPSVAGKLITSSPGAGGHDGHGPGGVLALARALDRRELEILRLIALGRGNKQIAGELCMAEQTVKNRVSRLYDKIAVKGREEARRLALDSGLVRPEEIL